MHTLTLAISLILFMLTLILQNFLVHFYKQHDHNHYIIEFYTPVASFYIPWRQGCGVEAGVGGFWVESDS